MMKPLVVFVALLGLCIGCATMKPEEAATLNIECNVPEAAVLLDDVMVGRAAELKKEAKSIRPGFYRVEIRHPGYYSYFTEITVAEGGAAAVKAELHPLLD
jgi:hypothetical protein